MSSQENDYKPMYRSMKRKLKILIYENECFQEELRKSQRSLLRVQRDKSFLLDRIMQYQQGPESSSDSEQTDESDNESYTKDSKRRKLPVDPSSSYGMNLQGGVKGMSVKKKKTASPSLGGAVIVTKNVNASRQGGKQTTSSGSSSSQSGLPSKGSSSSSSSSSSHKSKILLQANQASPSSACSLPQPGPGSASSTGDGHMSREEIERQLAARQPIPDFSTTVSLTLPNQLFSDLMEGDLIENDLETSPSNLGEEMNFESFD